MLFMMVVGGGAAVVLLMMVVASCVVDDWQVVACLGLNGDYVGFWVCSWWRERERRKMVLGYIFYCVDFFRN